MELPHHLQTLYRHWKYHIEHPKNMSYTTATLNPNVLEQMFAFITERMHVWEQKILGQHLPFTQDPLLARYKFCNIFRELDRQTIACHTLLNPLRDNFAHWLLNVFSFRMIARESTLAHTGLLAFDATSQAQFYELLLRAPHPRYGNAYVFPVSTIQHSPTPTRETFLAYHVPRVIPRIAKEIKTWQHVSVPKALARILPLFGFQCAFLWTEVLIDVAYQFPKHITLFDVFPVGPGARPSCKFLSPHAAPEDVITTLTSLGHNTKLTYQHQPLILSAENWEGICCEFRKYQNLAQGKGRKRYYIPTPVQPESPLQPQ